MGNMVRKLTKTQKRLILITIMIISMIMQGEMIFLPTVDTIYNLYPENEMVINMAVSGAKLFLAAMAVVTGFLCDKFPKKYLLIIGGLMAALAGGFAVAVENAYFYLCMRIINALGMAIVNVSAISLLGEIFTDSKENARYVGFFNAAGFALSVVLGTVAGYLTEANWKLAYKEYLVFLIPVIMAIFFIPRMKPVKKAIEEAEIDAVEAEVLNEDDKKGFGGKFWLLIFDFVVFTHVFMVPGYYISTYFAENALGSSVAVGYINSACMGASFVGSLVFGPLYSKYGRKVIIASYVALAVGCLAFWQVRTLAMCTIVYIVQGVAYGVVFPYLYVAASEMVPKHLANRSLGFVRFAYAIGGFVTTFIVSMNMRMLNTSSFTETLGITTLVSFLVIVPELILSKWHKNSKKEA